MIVSFIKWMTKLESVPRKFGHTKMLKNEVHLFFTSMIQTLKRSVISQIIDKKNPGVV